eukprot:Nk52_evm1s1434 gene=Nk52_evmTU1s1434
MEGNPKNTRKDFGQSHYDLPNFIERYEISFDKVHFDEPAHEEAATNTNVWANEGDVISVSSEGKVQGTVLLDVREGESNWIENILTEVIGVSRITLQGISEGESKKIFYRQTHSCSVPFGNVNESAVAGSCEGEEEIHYSIPPGSYQIPFEFDLDTHLPPTLNCAIPKTSKDRRRSSSATRSRKNSCGRKSNSDELHRFEIVYFVKSTIVLKEESHWEQQSNATSRRSGESFSRESNASLSSCSSSSSSTFSFSSPRQNISMEWTEKRAEFRRVLTHKHASEQIHPQQSALSHFSPPPEKHTWPRSMFAQLVQTTDDDDNRIVLNLGQCSSFPFSPPSELNDYNEVIAELVQLTSCSFGTARGSAFPEYPFILDQMVIDSVNVSQWKKEEFAQTNGDQNLSREDIPSVQRQTKSSTALTEPKKALNGVLRRSSCVSLSAAKKGESLCSMTYKDPEFLCLLDKEKELVAVTSLNLSIEYAVKLTFKKESTFVGIKTHSSQKCIYLPIILANDVPQASPFDSCAMVKPPHYDDVLAPSSSSASTPNGTGNSGVRSEYKKPKKSSSAAEIKSQKASDFTTKTILSAIPEHDIFQSNETRCTSSSILLNDEDHPPSYQQVIGSLPNTYSIVLN